MDYIIVKENKNDFKNLEKIDSIEVPYIPIDIIEMIIKDYKFIKKFIDYKRDGTLALLKIYDIINIYDDNFNLNFEKKIRNWYEFFTLIKTYSNIFIDEGINFYRNKNILNYELINKNFLGPIIEKVFDYIYLNYLKKFPYWPEDEKQNDFINIDFKNKIDINNIRYYYHLQGIITIQDAKCNNPIYSFKAEFNGKPKLQIVCLNLNKIQYLRKNERNLKIYIDKIDDKIIAQNLMNLNLQLD